MCQCDRKPVDPGDKVTRWASITGAAASVGRFFLDLFDRWK
ncbi:hypothetical protein SAMN05421874_1288 [Nonomuraea maritima]|uniref:Uncharacterized protein n=1 Tax=Nonomuraea maritima TaxID=683260 RepID=A0A1G9MEI7_9ACTN|nr:hypothetical protein SAMN05421874_1288 [Nonomuraea maritima]